MLLIVQNHDPLILPEMKNNPVSQPAPQSTATISTDDIIAHSKGLLKEIESANKNPFPVSAFPLAIQQIIKETNQSLNFPIDFIGASLMHASALAIGNSHKIEAKNTWYESPTLYTAIVGKAGTNKSHPLSFSLKPFEEADKKTYKEYELQKQEYDYYISLSKAEREKEGITEPVKPVWRKHLVSDVTPEGLIEIHRFNKRGICLYSDELTGWTGNFNRYSNGNDEPFWLSAWSGKPINIDRKTGDPISIHTPYISVIGTIQNGVLKTLSGKNRSQNGFIDRILFVIPDNLKRPRWNEAELSNSIIDNWHTIISNLLSLSCPVDANGNIDPSILKLTLEAKELFIEWFDHNTDLSNDSDNEALAGINAKLSQYTLRFALILELLHWACEESDKSAVGANAMKGAIKLADYFRNTALKVQDTISNPLGQLPENHKLFYEALPEFFTTAEGLEVAKRLSIPKDTYHKFLRRHKGELFKNTSRGSYEKLV